MAVVRGAVPADIPELAEVFRRASLSNEGDRPALLAHPEVLEFDDTCVHEGRTLLAVEDDRVVGFVTTTPGDSNAVELDDLFVDPDWMRRGIATELMREARSTASRLGVRRIEVTANHHALAFYESVGFVDDGVAETRFGPAIRMHLDV